MPALKRGRDLSVLVGFPRTSGIDKLRLRFFMGSRKACRRKWLRYKSEQYEEKTRPGRIPPARIVWTGKRPFLFAVFTTKSSGLWAIDPNSGKIVLPVLLCLIPGCPYIAPGRTKPLRSVRATACPCCACWMDGSVFPADPRAKNRNVLPDR